MSKANLQAHFSKNAIKIVKTASSYRKHRNSASEPEATIPKMGPLRITEA